jgi:hypothetical protein
MERDAIFLELVALGLNGVLFVGDSVEESPKLQLPAQKDVVLASKNGGVLVCT